MEINEKLRNQLALFGITPENASQARYALFKQIHEICFHGQGGYQWETIYNMPIWLRKLTFKEISDFNSKQNNQIENQTKAGEKTLIDPSGKVNTPDFLQASKQYKKPSSYK